MIGVWWILLIATLVVLASTGIALYFVLSQDSNTATPTATSLAEEIDAIPTQTVITFVGGENNVTVLLVDGPSLVQLQKGESQTLTYTLSESPPSDGDITLIPVSNDENIRFNPQSLVWSAGGSKEATTVVTVEEGTTIRRVSVSYGATVNSRWVVDDVQETEISVIAILTAPSSFDAILAGADSSTQTFTLAERPLESVTVTPVATGLEFDPASVTWVAPEDPEEAVDLAQTFVVHAPVTGSVIGDNSIEYELSGLDSDLYVSPLGASIVCNKLTVTQPAVPSTLQLGATTAALEFTLPTLPETDVVITPAADGFTFTPTSHTWSAGGDLNKSFTAYAIKSNISVGVKTLTYGISGTDAGAYNALTSGVITGAADGFTLPTIEPLDPSTTGALEDWIAPYLPDIEGASVTLTPSATGLTFTPSSLTWTNGGSATQSATVTTAAGLEPDAEIAITYVVSGSESGAYSAPGEHLFNVKGNSPEPANAYTATLTYPDDGYRSYVGKLSDDSRFAVCRVVNQSPTPTYVDEHGRNQSVRFAVYRNDVGTWSHAVTLDTPFMHASTSTLYGMLQCAINGDGSYLTFHATHYQSPLGWEQMHLFKRDNDDGTSWTHVNTKAYPFSSVYNHVLFRGNRIFLMEGPTNPSDVVIWEVDGTDTMQDMAVLTGGTGYTPFYAEIAVNSAGDRIVIGKPNDEEVDIYNESGGTWTLMDTIAGGTAATAHTDRFGEFVQMSGDGNTVLVVDTWAHNDTAAAAPENGHIEIWKYNGSTWSRSHLIEGHVTTDAIIPVNNTHMSHDGSRIVTIYSPSPGSADTKMTAYNLNGSDQYVRTDDVAYDAIPATIRFATSSTAATIGVSDVIYYMPNAASRMKPTTSSNVYNYALIAIVCIVLLAIMIYLFIKWKRPSS